MSTAFATLVPQDMVRSLEFWRSYEIVPVWSHSVERQERDYWHLGIQLLQFWWPNWQMQRDFDRVLKIVWIWKRLETKELICLVTNFSLSFWLCFTLKNMLSFSCFKELTIFLNSYVSSTMGNSPKLERILHSEVVHVFGQVYGNKVMAGFC